MLKFELEPIRNLNFDSKVKLMLPKIIYAVPGEETSIYFDNIVEVFDIKRFAFEIRCEKGEQMEARWRFRPALDEAAGDHRFLLRVFDENWQMVAEAESMLVVRRLPEKKEFDQKLTWLCVGDSLTDAALYPEFLLKKMKIAGLPVQLTGRHAGSGKPVDPLDGIALEGIGGWRYETYCTAYDESTDTYRSKSPFLKKIGNELVFDIPGYFERHTGRKVPDIITFFLGCNDIGLADISGGDAAIEWSLHYMNLLISEFKKHAPKARFAAVLPHVPAASGDAFGLNYQCLLQHRTYRMKQHRLAYRVLQKYGNEKQLSIIPLFASLDSVYAYPMIEEPAFAGSTVMVRRQSNAVHPSLDGYHQIADVFYQWFIGQELL